VERRGSHGWLDRPAARSLARPPVDRDRVLILQEI
jgi:hypothetical protein